MRLHRFQMFTAIRSRNATYKAPVLMAKCEQGYLCDVCGRDVEDLTDSELYLRYILGQVRPDQLHRTPERHIRCNPTLAQFIVDPDFESVHVEGPFDKAALDAAYVSEQEAITTRAWRRLQEIPNLSIHVIDYPLPEVRERWRREAEAAASRHAKPGPQSSS